MKVFIWLMLACAVIAWSYIAWVIADQRLEAKEIDMARWTWTKGIICVVDAVVLLVCVCGAVAGATT